MPAVGLARLLGFDTADNVVIPCIGKGQTPVDKGRNYHLVVVIGGNPMPMRVSSAAFIMNSWGAVPDTDRKGGLGQLHMYRGFNTHKGKVVGGVKPLAVLPACNKVLKHAVARKSSAEAASRTLLRSFILTHKQSISSCANSLVIAPLSRSALK